MNLFMLSFEMFSAEHFITLGVILAIILVLFFTRKFFIRYKIADVIFRWVLAFLIIGSETKLRLMNPPASFVRNFPIPLCGHLLWIAGLALVSNSSRLYKAVYPLCLLGATMSMIVVEGIPNFPEFRAWQYFLVHGGFLIGALYFVFTRKINKFTWKDYGYSMLLLLCMGAAMSIFTMLGIRDDYMIIHPAGIIQPVLDACGQVGYTVLYMLVIASIVTIFSFFTWLFTKHRKDEDENLPKYVNSKVLDKISTKYTKRARWISVATSIAAYTYLLVLQDQTATKPYGKAFAYILLVLLILIFGLIIFNEVLNNYEISKKAK